MEQAQEKAPSAATLRTQTSNSQTTTFNTGESKVDSYTIAQVAALKQQISEVKAENERLAAEAKARVREHWGIQTEPQRREPNARDFAQLHYETVNAMNALNRLAAVTKRFPRYPSKQMYNITNFAQTLWRYMNGYEEYFWATCVAEGRASNTRQLPYKHYKYGNVWHDWLDKHDPKLPATPVVEGGAA